MFDHYSINVSERDGTHFDGRPRFVHLFATAPGSLRDKAKADDVLIAIKARFPEAEGFKVSMTQWVCRGHAVEE
jgi:hypothetical protein